MKISTSAIARDAVCDPLLTPSTDRFTMLPGRDPEIWEMFKKQESSLWRADEVDLSADLTEWKSKLTDNERFFISMILAFFASSDGIVLENLATRFLCDVQTAEARAFYAAQMFIENVHSECYSMMLDAYINDLDCRNKLYHAIDNFECIRKKAEWAQKWIADKDATFNTRIIAFACVEGIFFSGAFCSIYWLKKRGLMPGLTFSNELISRDEALHCEFAVLMHNKILDRAPADVIQSIIRESVELEKAFICDALPCHLIGMNSALMSTYIEFIADRLSLQLGAGTIYGAKNPFDFMDMISIEGKTNFFERRVGEYSMATVTTDGRGFNVDSDF